MKTRMEKYYEEDTKPLNRSAKNETLYEKMSSKDLDDFKIGSNAEVLAKNAKNIDIEEIKSILDHKYSEAPKRRSIVIEDLDSTEEIIVDENTREYDINSILEKARETKETNYDTDRLKKLRDTQYNILKNLDLELAKKGVEVEELPSEEETLMSLINTITEKETNRDDSEVALEVLADLKGSEDTQIIEGITEVIEEKTIEEKQDKKSDVDKSFYTNSVAFTKSDFDDFNDLKTEVKTSKALIKFLVVLIVIALVAGIVVLLNSVLGLGWF